MPIMNAFPHIQPLTGPFTWANFQSGLGQAHQNRSQWVREAARDSWRDVAGFTCAVNPSYMADIQGWFRTGGPAITTVNSASRASSGACELQLAPDLSIVLDPAIPPTEAHWHAHWEKD